MDDQKEAFLTFTKAGPVTIGRIRQGSLRDPSSVADFGAELRQRLKDAGQIHLLLDFSRVDYVSSAVLSELITAREIAARQEGSIRIAGLRPEVQKVFRITRLDRVFHCGTSGPVRDAVNAYHRDLEGTQNPKVGSRKPTPGVEPHESVRQKST